MKEQDPRSKAWGWGTVDSAWPPHKPRGRTAWGFHPSPHPRTGPQTGGRSARPAPGQWGLTLARWRVRNVTWGAADDGVPLHVGRVWWQFTEDTQQHILLAQGWEGTDIQLHLQKGCVAPTRTPMPGLGVW